MDDYSIQNINMHVRMCESRGGGDYDYNAKTMTVLHI